MKNHFTALWYFSSVISLFIFILLFVGYQEGFIIAFVIWFLIFGIPTLYVHYEYFKIESKQKVSISNGKLVFLDSSSTEVCVNIEEPIKMKLWISELKLKDTFMFTPWENYAFLEIYHPKGRLVLTSLNHDIFKKVLKLCRDNFEIHRYSFNSIAFKGKW